MKDEWIKRKQNSPTEYSETHPSYGIIGINQTSGRGVLFGSEVVHQHFISITISEAKREVQEPREFLMPTRELIRIAMTAAQFGELITSPNRGTGTACTIERFTGDAGEPWADRRTGMRPRPPEPDQYTEKFKNVLGNRAATISKEIGKAKEQIDRLMSGDDKPTKANLKALQSALYMAQMNFNQNIPYVMEEVEESIENRVSKAKTEFESYIAHSLQHKGLEHLANAVPRLATPEPRAITAGEEEER